jgi:hypothetical protein
MPSSCSAYTTDTDAYAAVDRLLAAGTSGERITVLTGSAEHDHRDERVGSFAGDARVVGAFAGASRGVADAMGSFVPGAGDARRGSFGDGDRDVVMTFQDGVRRAHVASHHELARVLADTGLDAAAVADDVAALHHGRVLVLVAAA